METNKDKVLMCPTVEWMRKKYDEMNNELFNGELGECDFDVRRDKEFASGETLGTFRMTKKGCHYYKKERRLFIYDYWGDEIYVDRGCFYETANPLISLNGNYTATEESLLHVLVHEMCHYYNYMWGYIPKQAHGKEFREIASVVSSMSSGRFTVTRIASAEVMQGFAPNADLQAKIDRKSASLCGVLVFTKKGEIELTTTTSKRVIDEIVSYNSGPWNNEVILVSDPEFAKKCAEIRKNRNFRTYRFYNVTDCDFCQNAKQYKHTVLYKNEEDMKESKNITEIIDRIVKRTIKEELEGRNKRKHENKIMSITPDMNLGLESPCEINGY